MKLKTTLMAAAVAVTAMVSSAAAATLGVIGVGGLAVEPPAGASTSQDLGAGTVNEIVINLGATHYWPSWGSETRVRVTAPDGSNWYFTGYDFGWGSYSGAFTTNYTRSIAPTSAAGTWTVAFNDSYDDYLAYPDYRTWRGSTVSLNGMAAVPLPAALPLALAGFAALGGLGMARRRRG